MGEAAWRWPIAERVLAQLRAEGTTNLLEIGAGVGFTARWFADHGLEVTATDLSPAQVELIREKGLEAQMADLYDLPFEPGSFDAAWAMNCLHHVASADLHDVLLGIGRVLRPDGLFYLGVWGGVDEEGMIEDDFYQPARFLSLRSDTTLRAAVEEVFTVEWFETFVPDDPPEGDDRHMQSMLLRRP
jgi:SAM-dependent methyltransferase